MTNTKVLTTPESAFKNLVDYPFNPNYIDIDGMNLHYLDEGQDNSKTIFLFHGQPSWSYLYRHMIPVFVDAGFRVIAPDLIGFGKSDKPVDPLVHTYENHVHWMTLFVKKLGIKGAAAYMQDWGGMIGMRVLANEPEWLDRLVISNTVLPDAKGIEKFMMPKMMKLMTKLAGKATLTDFQNKMSFGNWSSYFLHSKELEIGKIMQTLTETKLTDPEAAAYDAPFPDDRYYAGPRRMPQIISTQLTENRKAWTETLENWHKPVLTLYSDKDPFLAKTPYEKQYQRRFPGAKYQPHTVIKDASHFLQEDKGLEISYKVVGWLEQTQF